MALENKLLRDAQGRPMMNEFQSTVFVAEQVVDHVQRVVIALKNAGYRLPKLITVSVDGIVGHLTDDPIIKKAIIKRARKAGLKMADVEIKPKDIPGQEKSEQEALQKLDAEEEKIDKEVEAASASIDADLEAMLICEKPEQRMSKKMRKLKAQGMEHQEMKTVLEAAARLMKSTNPEDQAAAKKTMELLMGPDPADAPVDPVLDKFIPKLSAAVEYLEAVRQQDALREVEKHEAEKTEKKRADEKKTEPDADGNVRQ